MQNLSGWALGLVADSLLWDLIWTTTSLYALRTAMLGYSVYLEITIYVFIACKTLLSHSLTFWFGASVFTAVHLEWRGKVWHN